MSVVRWQAGAGVTAIGQLTSSVFVTQASTLLSRKVSMNHFIGY